MPDRVAPGHFPPELVVQVKALACELPAAHHLPLSWWSLEELTRHVCQSGLVAQLSQTTLAIAILTVKIESTRGRMDSV